MISNLANWALVVIAGVAAYVVWKQAKQTANATKAMERQTAIAYRAYLAVGKPSLDHDRNLFEASFPIWNYGQVDAHVTRVEFQIIGQDDAGREVYRGEGSSSIDVAIAPAKAQQGAYSHHVVLPQEAICAQIVTSGEVTYETGFKAVDTLHFVRIYLTGRREWVTGTVTGVTDLAKTKHKNPN